MEKAQSGPELRIVMLGKSNDEKTTLSTFISGTFDCHQKSNKQLVPVKGTWRRTPFILLKTSDMFSQPTERVRHKMKMCVANCPPGPNVLLLVTNPLDFTEEDRQKMRSIMSFFGPNAFNHSVVITTHDDSGGNPAVNQLIEDCRQRKHRINFDGNCFSEHNLQELMKQMESIVSDNRGYLTFEDLAGRPLQLMLCGRDGGWKTSAANAILGQGRFGAPANSELLKHQAEVGGHAVSVLVLPALYGKPDEAAMRESYKCVLLFEPEGVHAFILVLPLDRPTDEDREELEAIQNTFKHRINQFTVILFTVEASDQRTENYIEEDSQGFLKKLIADCGERYHVFNNNHQNDRLQVTQLLREIEEMVRKNGGGSYTSEMFPEVEADREGTIQSELERKFEEEMQVRENKFAELTAKFEEKIKKHQAQLAKEMENLIKKQENRNRQRKKREGEEGNQECQEEVQEHEGDKEDGALQNETQKQVTDDATLLENGEITRRERTEEEQRERYQEEQRQVEYKQEQERHEIERQQEEKIQREKEEEELKEKYRNQLEELRRTHEKEARKQAEECSEFRQKFTQDTSAYMEKCKKEAEVWKLRMLNQNDLILWQLRKNKRYDKSFDKLKKRQNQEMNDLKSLSCFSNTEEQSHQVEHLKEVHQEEIEGWIQQYLKNATEKSMCSIL